MRRFGRAVSPTSGENRRKTAKTFDFPVIAAQIYKFVAPGLYKNERAAFLPFLIASPILFLLGADVMNTTTEASEPKSAL